MTITTPSNSILCCSSTDNKQDGALVYEMDTSNFYVQDGSDFIQSTYITSGPIHSSYIIPPDVIGSTQNGYNDIIERLKRLERQRSFVQVTNCPHCGGTAEIDIKNHILKCQYCKSVLFVNTNHINDSGDIQDELD